MSWLLLGWPGRSVGMLAEGPAGQKVLDALRADCEAHDHFKGLVGKTRGARELVQRSSMGWVSVQQLVSMCQASEWRLSDALQSWLREVHAKNVCTQVVEDAFQAAKTKVEKQSNHRAREARAFGTIIERQVLSQRHHYVELLECLRSCCCAVARSNAFSTC
jgi:hypothetical protein